MSAIALHEPLLIEETQQVAAREGVDAAEVLAEAVRHYLTLYRQKRIATETEAWYAMPAEDRQRYTGKYVAVYDGQIVDSDQDRLALFFRAHERFGRYPILITEGGDQPIPVYRVRSPQTIRPSSVQLAAN